MSTPRRAPIVVVSGLPGAGKSSLAAQLRDALGLALVSLDSLKEAVVDGLGPDAPQDRFAIRLAAREATVRLAEDNPRGCVIDIWINPVRDDSGFADAMREIDGAHFVEVVCRVPVEVALERYTQRRRHPAHLPMDDGTRDRVLEAAPRIGPLGLGPHLDVDTSVPVDDERLADVVDWLVGQGVRSAAS